MRWRRVAQVLIPFLAGCTPYASYTHISDPRIANDGFDYICGGGEKEYKSLTSSVGVCKDIRGSEVVKVEVKYRPR